MLLIAGLGNPGVEYALTRHNIGWNVIDHLVDRIGAGTSVLKFGGTCWGPLTIGGERVCLLKPYTYMNNSGLAVGELARFYKIEPQNILIVVDDVNLPLGKMRLRGKGSAGGHNGLKSIIAHLSSQDFPRLRIGVGGCPESYEMVNWVLGHFSEADRRIIDNAVDMAATFCVDWCSTETSRLMNRVNSCNAANLNGEA